MLPRWLLFTIFITIMVGILGSAHYYLYRRLRTAFPPKTKRAARLRQLAFTLLAISFPASFGLLAASYNIVTCAFNYVASVWLGTLMYLFFCSIDGQILLWLLGVVQRRKPTVAQTRVVVVTAFAVAVAIAGWGLYEAACAARTTRVTVPIKGLPASLDGFTIAQITDVHVGAIINARRLERIVAHVNSLDADLVVITGDLVDRDAKRFAAVREPLTRLRSRLGVYAVTGNHEYFSDVEAAVRHATAAGITFLRNEKKVLENGLVLYGVDDRTGIRLGYKVPELEQVIDAQARRAPAILLYHRPKGLERAASLGIDLMLSGHTHGGQLWPITYISRIGFPRQYGLYRHGDSHIYVSRGIGTWGPPMRVAAPPEVALITLKRP